MPTSLNELYAEQGASCLEGKLFTCHPKPEQYYIDYSTNAPILYDVDAVRIIFSNKDSHKDDFVTACFMENGKPCSRIRIYTNLIAGYLVSGKVDLLLTVLESNPRMLWHVASQLNALGMRKYKPIVESQRFIDAFNNSFGVWGLGGTLNILNLICKASWVEGCCRRICENLMQDSSYSMHTLILYARGGRLEWVYDLMKRNSSIAYSFASHFAIRAEKDTSKGKKPPKWVRTCIDEIFKLSFDKCTTHIEGLGRVFYVISNKGDYYNVVYKTEEGASTMKMSTVLFSNYK